jgi:hypothetical protein
MWVGLIVLDGLLDFMANWRPAEFRDRLGG